MIKDKILIQDSALVMADQIASNIPLLNIAWGLSKAFLGSGLKLRQDRALEWVEMIRDNPNIFTKIVLNNQNFQDGFVYSLENFIRERSEEKRKIIKKFFLGFSESESEKQKDFLLEKIFHSLAQLSPDDIKVLRDVSIKDATAFKPEDENGNPENKNLLYQIYGNKIIYRENIYNLINLGLFIDETGNRLGHHYAPLITLSKFGLEFIKYIQKE